MSFFDFFRSSKKSSAKKRSLDTARPALPLIHDRHNYFLSEISGEGEAQAIVVKAMLDSPTTKAIQSDKYVHIIDGNDGLKMSALGSSGTIYPPLPYFENPSTWPFEIKTLLPYTGGPEGILRGVVNGAAAIGFYDHFYFANADQYPADTVQNFSVSGLCYKLEIGSVPNGYAEDFCMYLPISKAEGGAEDELRFLTRVEALERFDFYGIPFLALKVCLARVNGFDMNTTLFVPQSSAPESLKVGDRVSGMAWMFGFLAS